MNNMAQVIFVYNTNNITIQCKRTDKMKDIFNRFYSKTNTNSNSVFFIYSGSTDINSELKFEQIANNFDKMSNKMTILVSDKYFKDTSIKKSGNNIKQPQGKPFIFETMDNLNKRFEKLEMEIKEKSKDLKRKIENMQNKLMKIKKEKIRFASCTYYGETINGEVNGLGIAEFNDGTRYEGYFLDSDKNGVGILYDNNGVIFQGEFKKNERNGFGIEENPDVGIYEGNWLNNGINGTGMLSHNDGRIYIGQFDKAQYSGFGKMLYPDGDYYIGQIKNGCREKVKTFYSEENGIFDATWNETENKSIAKGIFYFSDGRQEKRTRIIDENNNPYWEYN